MSQTVKFKENPRAGNLGLEKQGRSKFPGCVDIIQASIGRDGRWKTGLDEDAISVTSITDSEIREKKRKERKDRREALERLLNLDLSGKSTFWESFFIEVNPNQPLNMAIPMDEVKYHVLMESGSVAPDIKSTLNMDYKDAKFYVAREFEEVGDKVAKQRMHDRAIIGLTKLMENFDKALVVFQYMGLPVSNNTPHDNMYEIARGFIDGDASNVSLFLDVLEKTPEELNIKLIFREALKTKAIRYRDGLYQRGNITFGSTEDDAIIWLSDPVNNGELLSIRDEVKNKIKTKS